jgi:hypothetical protein
MAVYCTLGQRLVQAEALCYGSCSMAKAPEKSLTARPVGSIAGIEFIEPTETFSDCAPRRTSGKMGFKIVAGRGGRP